MRHVKKFEMFEKLPLTPTLNKLLNNDSAFNSAELVTTKTDDPDSLLGCTFYEGIEFVPTKVNELPIFFRLIEQRAETYREYIALYREALSAIQAA